MALLKRSDAPLKISTEKRLMTDAVRVRYPQLSSRQCEQLADVIIKQVAKAIREGKYIGTFSEGPNGEIAVSMWKLVDQAAEKMIAG